MGERHATPLLVVFQAMDAAGKDGAIEHVMSGVNPQGVQVVSFKQPSAEELDHDFLWRIAKALPERGRIGIFNRSHYEEVVVLRVHPEWLERAAAAARRPRRAVLAGALRGHQRLRAAPRPQRHEDREVLPPRLEGGAEAALPRAPRQARQGVEVQRRRRRRAGPLGRLHGAPTRTRSRPRRRPGRRGTSSRPTTSAVMQALVAAMLVDTIRSLDLQWPTVSEADHEANIEARRELDAEEDRSRVTEDAAKAVLPEESSGGNP